MVSSGSASRGGVVGVRGTSTRDSRRASPADWRDRSSPGASSAALSRSMWTSSGPSADADPSLADPSFAVVSPSSTSGWTRPRPRARRGSNRSRSPRGHPRSPWARRGRAGTRPQPRSASWSRRMSSRSPYGATWPWHSWPRRASRGASPRPRPSQPSPPSDPSRRCARDEPSRSAGPSRDTPAPRAPKCNREPIPRRTREHPAKLHTRVRESRQAPRGVTRERDDDRLFPRGARRRPHRQISRVHRAHRSRRTDRDARASVSTSETKKNSGPRGVARIGKRKSGGASGKGFLRGTPVCLFSRMFDPVQISIKISECYLSDKFPTHLGDIIGSRTELPAEIVKRREQAPPEISGSSVLNQSDFLSFSDVRMISLKIAPCSTATVAQSVVKFSWYIPYFFRLRAVLHRF